MDQIYSYSDGKRITIPPIFGMQEKQGEKFLFYNDRKIHFSTILHILFFHFLEESITRQITSSDKLEDYKLRLINLLNNLNRSLEKLKREDLSQSKYFVHELSKSWKDLSKGINQIGTHYSNYKQISNLKLLIKKISNYTANTNFKFADQLDNYKEKKSIPSTFVQMLHCLHNRYVENQQNSELTEFNSIISALVLGIKNNY